MFFMQIDAANSNIQRNLRHMAQINDQIHYIISELKCLNSVNAFNFSNASSIVWVKNIRENFLETHM
jgi:hypothetical protein